MAFNRGDSGSATKTIAISGRGDSNHLPLILFRFPEPKWHFIENQEQGIISLFFFHTHILQHFLFINHVQI